MTSTKLWLCVSLCFICFHAADGYPFYWYDECVFNSTELQDIQHIRSYYFNKQMFAKFDSKVGEFVGNTERGVEIAEYWNNQPGYMVGLRAQREGYWKDTVKLFYSNVLDKRVEPYVRLSSVTPPGGSRHTVMLKCSIYGFYPKLILVTWLRDRQPITSDVSSSDELGDGDWYYQYHAFLEYTPRSGEKISCMVELPSQTEPKIVDWDDSMPEADKNRIAIGASGLVLGVVLFLSGFIYYQWKKQGRILVPTGDSL